MAKRDYFLRYLLIIRKLRSVQTADFAEIARFVLQQSELMDRPLRLNIRTFQRDLKEICSIFGIDIRCNRQTHRYSIAEDLQEGSTGRILEAFDVFSALTQVENLSSHILLEKRCATGTTYLFDLLRSMKQKRIVQLIYQKYGDTKSTLREVEPYALKEFKNRWYLFANDRKDDTLKTFGLDRIQSVHVTTVKFSTINPPDPSLHFKDCFGIIKPYEGSAEEVVFSTDPEQAMYLKSFPLHESQHIIEENDLECIFSLKVYITYDFVREIMSMGDSVKVAAPVSLHKELLRQARRMVKFYSHT